MSLVTFFGPPGVPPPGVPPSQSGPHDIAQLLHLGTGLLWVIVPVILVLIVLDAMRKARKTK